LIGKPDVVFIDPRPEELFQGKQDIWLRNGHIPGAKNIPWPIRDKLRSCILCQIGNYKMLQTLKVLASSSFEGFTPAPQSPHSLNDLRNLE
jgi:hypothetical protein